MEKQENLNIDDLVQNQEDLAENFDDALLDASAENQDSIATQLSKDQEIQDLKDKYLRLLAEFDNFKKRTSKERIDFAKFSSQEIIVSLLPVLDDFDRAIKHGHSTEGSLLIHNKLVSILKQKGLQEMNCTGELFDPSRHEAITELPVAEDQKNKIIDTLEKGYYLSDKIIRYAKVVVGK